MRYFMVFAALALAIFSLLSKFADKISHPRAAPIVASASTLPVSYGPRSFAIPRDGRGHFQTEARVDGRYIEFMVDTGASTIALTERSARKLGIFPSHSDYSVSVRTANGTAKAASVQLNSVDVGGLVVRDVRALVMQDDALSENLLGLSFLTRLKRFEYANNKLVLEQ